MQRHMFQVISLGRAGQVSRVAALVSKSPGVQTAKIIWDPNPCISYKSIAGGNQEAGGEKEKRPTWAYSLSQFCGEGAALLFSAPPKLLMLMKLAPELHTSAVRYLTVARRGAAPAGAGGKALAKAQLGNNNRKKTWRGPWERLSSGAE